MNIARLAISITAVDAASAIVTRVTKNIGNIHSEVKKLFGEGKNFQAFSKLFGEAGKYSAFASGALSSFVGVHQKIGSLMSAQDGLNQITVLTGKSESEMENFRKNIYAIASDTAQAPETLVAAAIKNIRNGLKGDEIYKPLDKAKLHIDSLYKSLKDAGTYATANFSKDLDGISDTTFFMTRQMLMTTDEVSKSLAGLHKIGKEGRISFESLNQSASSLLSEAASLGISESKGVMQIMAAASVAAKDTDAESAKSSVQSLLADMKKAKTDKSFAALGMDFESLNAHALANDDLGYIGHIAKEVWAATGGIIRRVTDHIGNLNKNAESLFKTGKTLQGFKEYGKIARDVTAWGTAGLGALIGVHQKVGNLMNAESVD
jgi:hypothetical protein